jgi:biotin carboxyl carrier protein
MASVRSEDELAPGAVRVSLGGASAGIGLPPIVVGENVETSSGRVARDGVASAQLERRDGPVAIRWLGPGAAPGSRRCEVVLEGWRFELDVEPAARAALRDRARRGRETAGASGPVEVRAIIPGVVVSVAVRVGDPVAAGQELLAIEAMKMQNELRAPREGTIQRIAAAVGSRIEVGDVLVVIE